MPNGHGGYPWMGSPLLLAVALLILVLLPFDPDSGHGRARPMLAAVIGVVFGCRVAYHLHRRSTDAYGGAYTDPDNVRRARIVYAGACVLYGALGGYLAHLLAEL